MKRNERYEASQTDEGRYRMLIEAVTDYAIYMLDPDGNITSWNPGARRFKGYEEAEIIGEHFSKFYTEEDRASGLPWRALKIAATEGKFESEGWRVRKDGTQFWAFVIIDPIKDNAGNLVGYAKVTRDLTERKKAEAELENARDALVHAQKLEAIGLLTGGIAHDFNNLLMAIQGSIELVRNRLKTDDPKILRFLDNALRGTQRGSALTQRMLAFARRQEMKFEAIDIPGAIREMTSLLHASLGPSIQIETHFPSRALPTAQVDSNQFELAILNLAVNARDAMPTGGIIAISVNEQTITKDPILKPGQYICVTVSDGGTGMDEHTLERAMEPFFTTKGIGKGTGLGLAMIHGMAQQSGGRLTLSSKLGFGTSAHLLLPVAADAQPAKGDPAAPGAPQVTQRLTVLAVEDDPLVALNTITMLEDLGHTVLSAPSGSRALEILRGEKVDLLITDQAMPGMTGLELVRIVRSDNSRIPIILATGYAEIPEGERAEFLKLAKPFRQDDLARAITRVSFASKSGG